MNLTGLSKVMAMVTSAAVAVTAVARTIDRFVNDREAKQLDIAFTYSALASGIMADYRYKNAITDKDARLSRVMSVLSLGAAALFLICSLSSDDCDAE